MTMSVDGGGVFPDVPLLLREGARIRVTPSADSREDMTIYVEGGRLHVAGHYGMVRAERIAPNRVTVHVVPPGGAP